MFAICIESSHSRGMGHLFRMLNFIEYLQEQNKKYVLLLNNDKKSKEILGLRNINFLTVNLNDTNSKWETKLINTHDIHYWVNDRLDTSYTHAQQLNKLHIPLITFDDYGKGAMLSDLNILGLSFGDKPIKGKKVLQGTDFLILNKEIAKHKRERKKVNKILVTLGGSDTFGVTLKVLNLLKKYKINADIHIGPSFAHKEELTSSIDKEYKIITYVESLIKTFYQYDLAITGGGITSFEANATGLPCLIIANEIFETHNGQLLAKNGSSIFLGHHSSIDESIFQNINSLDISSFSKKGLKNLHTNGCENIFREIIDL